MGRKECFGSIKEITLKDGLTMTQSRPECRDCLDFRDCLNFGKMNDEEKKEEKKRDKDELRKQDMITRIIDSSVMISNEMGSCLLEFLNRIYNTSLGTLLFGNFLLFFEVPRNALSSSLLIPVSRNTLDLMQGGGLKEENPGNRTGTFSQRGSKEEIFLEIVLIQSSFPNNRKACIGLIACEVARLFSSDSRNLNQVFQVLTESEIDQFKRMDGEMQVNWLLTNWGFSEELKALKEEISLLGTKKKTS